MSVAAARPRATSYSEPAAGTSDVEVHTLQIPVVPLASTTELVPGALDEPPLPNTGSRGAGSGTGAGSGDGGGDGPGTGDGLGPGRDRGTGGKFYGPGAGVTLPVELRKGSPQYTAEAVRARAQGSIIVECVVQPSGTCSDFRVKRSMNPAFGLEAEAIKAAAQWRFRPGMRDGQPVPVLVSIEIVFAIR